MNATKKLSLAKETLRSLDEAEKDAVAGGYNTSVLSQVCTLQRSCACASRLNTACTL